MAGNKELYSSVMGKCIYEVNKDDEELEELEELMGMTVNELIDFLNSAPKAIKGMKISTIFDILVNVDEEAIAELAEFGKEEEEEDM